MRIMTCSSTYLLVLSCCLCLINAEHIQAQLKIAVYRHPRPKSLEYNSTSVSVKTNLDHYSRAAEIAKSQESDMIIFPEFGINPPVNQAHLQEYLEYVPDPRKRQINPCKDPDNYSHRPMLYTLSCIALNNSMVVMANTGIIEDCAADGVCPQEGIFHFTNNVVFDKHGTLIMKQSRIRVRVPLPVDPTLPQEP